MLSKSQYTKFLQCPKLFWLYRKDKNKLSMPSFHQQQIFKTGSEVGDLAQQLFPGGTEIPFNIKDVPGMVLKTNELIKNGDISIYEASFTFNEIFVAVDILTYSDGKWHIYEVKSSTGVKETYLDDAAIQNYVLKQSGIEIGSVNIIHINNKYIRNKKLDITQLFSIVDITDEANQRVENIPSEISRMKTLLNNEEPKVNIGPHCFQPYECSGYEYCWKTLAEIPDLSVFTLVKARQDKKFDLYQSGIINVSDVSLEDRTPMQQLQILGQKYIEHEKINDFTKALAYPVTHLDFETFQQAIPEYSGLRPFQQIPFQFSIHIESEGGIEHREFLAPIGVDPRRLLAEQLIHDTPRKGSILAYNRSFEVGVIKRLAETFEDLSINLISIANRIEDLMTPFQKGWYYHPQMNGSYSIKKVLPALVPEMEEAYKELPIVHNGGEASSMWGNLIFIEDEIKVKTIRNGLLEYCKLDTLAMVEILKVLRGVNG